MPFRIGGPQRRSTQTVRRPAGTSKHVAPGRPEPLGATWDGEGTNSAVFSSTATSVELCLFDGDSERHVKLPASTQHIWHGYVKGIGPGTRYGFRVHGEWAPERGFRCNPAKLLLDPYARHVTGELVPDPATLPYVVGSELAPSTADSAPFVPRSVVIDPSFDWENDKRPRIPMR